MEKFLLTDTKNNYGPYHDYQYEAAIFFFGCNLHCDFCYNGPLVKNEYDFSYRVISGMKELIDAFKNMKDKRSLYITGGEPLFNSQYCNDILTQIRAFNPRIKLGIFTNGTFSSQLDDLIRQNLIDFVHIDYKIPFSMNENTFGLTEQFLSNVRESIRMSYRHLMDKRIDYLHLNTVLIDGIHLLDTIKKLIDDLPTESLPFFGIVDYDSPLKYLKQKKFIWYFTRLFQPETSILLNPEYTEETKRLKKEDLEELEKFLSQYNLPFKDLFERNDNFHDKRRMFWKS
jgi:pyruvate-formate lyase-activating enzyme